MGRWHRYWFAEGGRYSAAILRMGIAVAVLLSLWRLWHQPELAAPGEIYRPVGVWMLLGRTPPPALLVDLLWLLAWGGTLAMLAGAWTRAATAISFGAGVALAALSFSGSITWSHQYNVVFVAQLAFLGARGGDALSIDALVRRRRGLPPLDVPRGYQWSVRLVLLAVSLMFISAALFKVGAGQFTLRWALSDNLRHQLLIRYDLVGIERPAIVDWLLEDVARYRTAAVLNIASQLAPLLAVVFVRRPLVRAFAGACFVLEIIGLGAVMRLWNLHWLPLAAVFIDWDRLLRIAPAPAESPPDGSPPRARRVFVIAFVVYEIAISLIPRLDQKLNTFPFSSYPMFAHPIRAARPYDRHLPFGVVGDHYEAISDHPLDARAQRWLDHANRGLHAVRDPARLRARLAVVLARAQERYPELGIRGMRHHVSLFVAPAYPAPARFDRHDLAITGELVGGVFRSLLGAITKSGVRPAPQNLDDQVARFFYFADDRLELHALGGVRRGDEIAVALRADPVYVVAEIDEVRWLVAWRRTWRWD